MADWLADLKYFGNTYQSKTNLPFVAALIPGILIAMTMVPVLAAPAKRPADAKIRAQSLPLFDFDSAIMRKERIIDFPTEYSLGALTIADSDKAFLDRHAGRPFGQAQGRIVVPPHRLLRLTVGPKFYAHLKDLGRLNQYPVDGLKISLTSFDDSETGLCDRALALASNLTSLQDLDLDRSDTSDIGLACAAKLANLRRISAFGSQIDGSSLKALANLKKLRCLRLSANPIKLVNLQYLSLFPGLQMLSLSRTRLTDAEMPYIASCAQLRLLDVSRTPGVTDAGVKILAKLRGLGSLNVIETKVTATGLTALKECPLTMVYISAGMDMAPAKKIFPNCRFDMLLKNDGFADSVLAPLHN